MGRRTLIFAILTYFSTVDAGILLWSPIPLHIPALKNFRQGDFDDLVNDLQHPNILAFTTDSKDNIPRHLNNFYSSYVATTDLDLENPKLLSDDLDTNTNIIKESLIEKNDGNLLIVVSLNDKRNKRDVTSNQTTSEEKVEVLEKTEPHTTETTFTEHKGPVVYSAEGSVMLYSSKAPQLRLGTSTLWLGPASIVTKDNRDGYTRLIASIVVENGKVILRFKFPSLNGYWSLASVELVDQRNGDNKSYNLTITCNVGAQNRFSYHCHKDTVFRDSTGNVELVLYQIQAQTDAKNGRFSDAYNCVNFTTVPIWSGLLVSMGLIMATIFALLALGNIKTMDKFDNYKTKQLNITVAE